MNRHHLLAPLFLPLWCLLFVSTLALAAAPPPPSQALAHMLAPAELQTIQGQSLKLKPFTLTVLTNETHALFSFELGMGRDKIGWIAVGFGTQMTDSAMVILWPQSSYVSWVLSARSVPNYAMPMATTTNYTGFYDQGTNAIISNLDLLSIRSGCRASFIRPLEYPLNQKLYPRVASKYLNLSRTNTKQNLVFAYSSSRPDGDDPEQAWVSQHDSGSGMFGPITVDMTMQYIPGGSSTNGSIPPLVAPQAVTPIFTFRQNAILVHAGLGIVTWTVFAPAGVLIGRFCRMNPKWYRWHSSLQLFITFPLTVIILGFGLYGGQGHGILNSAHQMFGIALMALVCAQILFGFTAHKTPGPGSLGPLGDGRFTRSQQRVVHIILGSSIMVLGFIQVQVGLALYAGNTMVNMYYGLAIGNTILFCLLILYSLHKLIRTRHSEGRSWKHSIFGLGQFAATPARSRIGYPRPGLHNDSTPSIVVDTQSNRDSDPFGRDTKEDLGSMKGTLSTPRRRSFQVEQVVLDGRDTPSLDEDRKIHPPRL